MSSYRKDPLENGFVYHIYTRSISKYRIFNDKNEYKRMLRLLELYRLQGFHYKMSEFEELSDITQYSLLSNLKVCNNVRVKIIAYCLMPTHIHLVLEQTDDRGIEKFMGRVLNAYARYFNTKHGRQCPLWSSRFKSVLVKDDDQLLHLTRYIHLNPVSADLVEKPENWKWSSYLQYIEKTGLCDFQDRLDIEPKRYKKFVDDRKAYQKSLSKIKSLIIENYSD